MQCERCHRSMAKERDEELDSSSELSIQARRCPHCGCAIEQITIQSERKRAPVRRICYAVRSGTNALTIVKRTPASRD